MSEGAGARSDADEAERASTPGMQGVPVVASMDMGYGHLRAALPIARCLGTDVIQADRPPVAGPEEQRAWAAVRLFHESGSRVSQLPVVGTPMRRFFEQVTAIPRLHPLRDLSAADAGVKALDWAVRRGLGRGLAEYAAKTKSPVISTFYAPAVAAERHGCEHVYCLVTDSDIARVWAPASPASSRIHFFAPSWRAGRRLQAYGVPAAQVEVTGFPLPDALLGGWDLPRLRADVAARLVRLDPQGRFLGAHRAEVSRLVPELPAASRGAPITLTMAVGGAGAQVAMAGAYLLSLAPLVRAGRLRLVLVAGLRLAVAQAFAVLAAKADLPVGPGTGVEILHESTFEAYYDAFNTRLGDTDVLWTKPSEMTFYAALGLPLLLAPPVGVHERYNRRWALEAGAGLLPRDPTTAAHWLGEWLDDGTLAAAAWSGFRRLPRRGLYRIVGRFGPLRGMNAEGGR